MIQDLVILDELLKQGYDRRATPSNHLSASILRPLHYSFILEKTSWLMMFLIF